MPLKKVPDVGMPFGDKVFHTLTYAVLAFLWYHTFHVQFKRSKTKAIVYASVVSIFFGIIIEVLQEVFTAARQADVFDVLANSLGVLVTVFLLLVNNRNTVKKL